MKNRWIYTALGIALSLLIAFGGWVVTEGLLSRKERALLSERGSILPAAELQGSRQAVETPDLKTGGYPRLTASEIYKVLMLWESPGRRNPHEPAAGQLSMEQAIAAAEDWLSRFHQNGLIPEAVHELDSVNAYLSSNEAGSSAEAALTAENPSLKPFYSRWTVSYSCADMDAELVVNAGTGQVWRAEIVSKNAYTNFDGMSESEMLEAFTEYLSMDGADGLVSVNAEIVPGTVNGETVSLKAELSMSTVQP